MTNIEIKNKIVNLLDGLEYEKILLFGSRARGENREDSDYDVIVVLKRKIEKEDKFSLQNKIRKSFAKEKIDIDILVKGSEEYNHMKDNIGNVVYFANQEAIVL